ncbi:MAG: carbohydrate kinase family protein [Candidatus Aramenus sp.]|jgi:ribokinase|nr:carbohydrate kinase family protein [Candidatus Aramenus sp.]
MKPIHLSVGKFNVDVIVRLDKFPEADFSVNTDVFEILPGGSATNYSVAVNRLGHTSKLLSKVSKDYVVKPLMARLAEEGVGLDLVEEVNSLPNYALILLRKDGGISIVRRTIDQLLPTAEDVKKYNGIFDVVHFASIHPSVVTRVSKMITYDPGAYSKYYEGEEVDVLFVNKKEYEDVKGKANAKLLVVKMGGEGAMVVGEGEECYSEAIKTDVVDTTGAGDVFDAAFNVFYLEKNSLEDTLKLANVAAGIKVSRIGGTSSPTLEEVMQKLKKTSVKTKCK